MAPHPTHRPDRLSIQRNECGRGDVSQPKGPRPSHVKPRAGASFEPGSVPPSRATVGPQAAESSPAAWVALTSIGAGAGKIADWSIAGRIEEGQPVPRFGSVARSPLTGRGSDGRPVQFLDTPRIPSAAFPARVDVGVEFGGRLAVRLRVAGTALRCDVLGVPPARGVLEKLKLVFRRVLHALKHGVEHEQCGQQKLRNGSPR